MSAIEQRFRLEFERRESVEHDYKEINRAEARFRHVGEICSVCREDFQPEDRLTVLPCSHGMHKTCFDPWEAQTCPIDRTYAQGITRVSFLGYSLLFSPRTMPAGRWLFNHRERAEAFLSQNLQDRPFTGDLVGRIVPIFQDLLSVYDGIISSVQIPQQVERRLSELFTFLESLGLEENIELVGEEFDFNRISTLTTSLLHYIEFFRFLEEEEMETAEGLERLETCIRQVADQVTRHPHFFLRISQELDRRFHLKHFKVLRQMGSKFEKYSYLFKLRSEQLSRLSYLTEGAGGPTSQLIRVASSRITLLRKATSEIKKIEKKMIFIIALLGFGYFRLSDSDRL